MPNEARRRGPSPPGQRVLAWAVLCLCVFGLLLAGGCRSRPGKPPRPPVPGPTDIPPPDLRQTPDGIARDFLRLITTGKAEQAYPLLSQRARSRITQYEFTKKFNEGMREPAMAAAYVHRYVSATRWDPRSGQGIAQISDRRDPKAPVWTWGFVREDGFWRIDKLKAPPVSIE